MNFDIVPTAPTPIYRQIVEQVQRLVASGQMTAGAELPSVRALALLHAINPMTVSKAYSLLEAQGLLERRRGVGMVVAGQGAGGAAQADPISLLLPALAHAAQVARQLGIDDAAAVAAFTVALRTAPQGATLPPQESP
jgi:GntR family transcriptional regulator